MNPKQPCFHSKLYLVDEDSYKAVAFKSHSACESAAAAPFFLQFCHVAAHWQIIHYWATLGYEHNIKVKTLKYPFMLNLAIYVIKKKTSAEYKIKKNYL